MGIFDWKHWVVILIVVILVFGTQRLKTVGSDLGEAIKGFRKAMNSDEETTGSDTKKPTDAAATIQPQPQTYDTTAQKLDESGHKDRP
jgi:sec-independent protein translocase protein TatA